MAAEDLKRKISSEFLISSRGNYILECGGCNFTSVGNLRDINEGQPYVYCLTCLRAYIPLGMAREYQNKMKTALEAKSLIVLLADPVEHEI